jgi:hypothetical protein
MVHLVAGRAFAEARLRYYSREVPHHLTWHRENDMAKGTGARKEKKKPKKETKK